MRSPREGLAYVVNYYLSDSAKTDTNTTFEYPNGTRTKISLNSALNISAYTNYVDNPSLLNFQPGNGTLTEKEKTSFIDHSHELLSSLDPLFLDPVAKNLYNLTAIDNGGTCIHQSVTSYKWGFSFLLLYSFIAILMTWMTSTYICYVDCYLHSHLDLTERNVGIERAVLDLSAVMQRRFDFKQLELSSNRAISSLVKASNLSYTSLMLDHFLSDSRWLQLQRWRKTFDTHKWIRGEKWWLTAFLLFTGLGATGYAFMLLSVPRDSSPKQYPQSSPSSTFVDEWVPLTSFLPGFGCFLVLVVGRTTRSRWLLFALCSVSYCAGAITWSTSHTKVNL